MKLNDLTSLEYVFLDMKHRITYLLHGADDAVDPKKLDVKKDSLRVPKLDAAKEWRATIGVSDLPQEVRVHMFLQRWTSF